MDIVYTGATSIVRSLVTSPTISSPVESAKDFAKLVIIGGTLETARRFASNGWNQFIESFYLTAHFTQDDFPYDWLMHWLSKQPAWSRAREFEITTQSSTQLAMLRGEEEEEDDDEQDERAIFSGQRRRKLTFLPSHDTTHTIYYAGHWLRITRGKSATPSYYSNSESLKISVIARNNDIIKKLVLQAKREYERDAEHRVHIYLADIYGRWGWNGARHKRPLSSIVLEKGVKDMLLEDAKDFLRSEDWYAERGIPFRRGYLLHGVPGSGKTSLIHALAGELGLNIYVVTLSSKGMNDSSLAHLMGRVPSRCIVLLEDLDAAFTRSTNRDAKSTGSPDTTTTTTTESDGSTLSLSGLLNSLDGVAATEGRLLFATTNHIDRLDPALSRPGRMDVWVDFKNASSWQAEELFKNFFPYEGKPSLLDPADATPQSLSLRPPTRSTKSRYGKTLGPLLSEAEIDTLAKRFAEIIPDGELSVACLQGYLLKNKSRPNEAVKEAAAWVVTERETREKLQKEKEEKEVKAKEAKEAKEKEEKEVKEKAEKEAAKTKRREKREKEKRRAVRRAAGEVPTDSSESDSEQKPLPKETDTSAADVIPEAKENESDAAALISALVDAVTTKAAAEDAPSGLSSGADTPAPADTASEDGNLTCEEMEKLGESKIECDASGEESKSETWMAVKSTV